MTNEFAQKKETQQNWNCSFPYWASLNIISTPSNASYRATPLFNTFQLQTARLRLIYNNKVATAENITISAAYARFSGPLQCKLTEQTCFGYAQHHEKQTYCVHLHISLRAPIHIIFQLFRMPVLLNLLFLLFLFKIRFLLLTLIMRMFSIFSPIMSTPAYPIMPPHPHPLANPPHEYPHQPLAPPLPPLPTSLYKVCYVHIILLLFIPIHLFHILRMPIICIFLPLFLTPILLNQMLLLFLCLLPLLFIKIHHTHSLPRVFLFFCLLRASSLFNFDHCVHLGFLLLIHPLSLAPKLSVGLHGIRWPG